MEEKKVSIITPCYNGESYIYRFLNSLLTQNYQNVELIFVNDGSTDKTEEVFMSYKPRLEAMGWTVIYLKTAHKNQAAALNAGLKKFSGEYLMWPDSDDILYPTHIADKVKLMEDNPDCGIGFNVADEAWEDNLGEIVRQMRRTHDGEKDDLHNDLLVAPSRIFFGGIGNIVRASAFLDVVPDRDIYEGDCGQNFQMLYPISVKYKACYIEKSLALRVKRKASHSNQWVYNEPTRIFDHEDTFLHTIARANIPAEQKTKDIVAIVNFYEKRAAKYENEMKARQLATEKKTVAATPTPHPEVPKDDVFYLLGLPILKIKRSQNYCKAKLFGIITLFKMKTIK